MSDKSNSSGGSLTIAACIMIAVGGMVGSSIFTLSGVTYGMAGPGAIISWMVAGTIILLYALNLSELATTFPRMGGIFVYPNIILGKKQQTKDFAGWISAWSWLNCSVLGTAFSAICISTYLQEFIPVVKDSMALQFIIPLVWIFMGWLLNAKGISTMGKANQILITILMLIFAVFIIVGLGHADFQNFNPFVSGTMKTQGVIAGVPIAMNAYGSIIAIASIANEIKNPKRTIPRAMASAVLLTISVYSLILFTTFGLAPVQDFIADPSRQYYPLLYALLRGLNGKFGWLIGLIPLGALLAISNSMLIMIMDAGRTVCAVAESGFLPKKFKEIDEKSKTPVFALVLVAVVSAIITLRPDFIWLMINTGSICSAVTGAIIAFTVIVLRKKQASGEIKNKSEFQVPGGIFFPVISIIAILFILIVFYFGEGGAMSYMLAGGYYLIGIVIFAIRQMVKSK